MIAHSQETDETSDAETNDGTQLCRESQGSKRPVDQSAQHTGHRIDLLVEDDGFIIQ